MASLAMLFPILPGKTEEYIQFGQQILKERGAAHRESRQQAGLTREQAFLQSTPMGDMAIIYLEGADPLAAMQHIAMSPAPFDVWFRSRVLAIHGVDVAAPPPGPPPRQTVDWAADSLISTSK
ncbi:MAG TPA: hypothetical protein VKY74_19050 [Chloroflexia bacterium]|nr:hypothetical protein [Chloroflexia bacterium]